MGTNGKATELVAGDSRGQSLNGLVLTTGPYGRDRRYFNDNAPGLDAALTMLCAYANADDEHCVTLLRIDHRGVGTVIAQYYARGLDLD